MKKYLISGIPPSDGGVGYLMERLVKIASFYNYENIYPRYINHSLMQLRNPFKIFREILNRKQSNKQFINKLNKIKQSEVILIHPQSIGYKNFLKLIKNNTIIKVYIMDNSFFCIKSYNSLHNHECLKCIHNLTDCDSSCTPFPYKYKKEQNIEYLKSYKQYAKNIHFFAQNKSQADLLKIHFGSNTNVKIIGMKTGEIFKPYHKNKTLEYDIVFHGGNREAKGINYILELMKNLSEYTILIPYNKEDVNYNEKYHQHIVFKSMNWNTGLKEAVINARLVINPSIWSAPVEGALLKSIYYNGNVAVLSSQYGFINDIPDKCLIRLTSDIEKSALLIKNFLDTNDNIENESKNWLKIFLKTDCNLEELFKNV